MTKSGDLFDFDACKPLLKSALAARGEYLRADHGACRLFNGFLEGFPQLVVERYAGTLVIMNYTEGGDEDTYFRRVMDWYLQELPWVQTVIYKVRNAEQLAARRGVYWHGEFPDRWIEEEDVRYAIDLIMNQDTSFYLDTRNLRSWIKSHTQGKSVLNTFAYTGSLGAAAMAGGALKVIQTDLNRKFLNLAKTTYTLNGFPIRKQDFSGGDFFKVIAGLKRSGSFFDLVILDPPFFSQSSAGRVDLQMENQRLINKVRPLVAHAGYLIVVNNALFTSGADFLALLEDLAGDGYLHIEQLIPVPQDVTGSDDTRILPYPSNPAPFNHTTKIAVLKVFRKQRG